MPVAFDCAGEAYQSLSSEYHLKPPAFAYYSPQTISEALDLIADKENARILAGGQSLMPMLNLRLASPDHLIDLSRIPELRFIRENGDSIEIGAMTLQREIEFSALVAARLPLLAEAIRCVGHRQTRNRGTVGGSLCHLDPSAELPTVAMALDATLLIRSRKDSRELPMQSFPAGLMTPSIESDELLAQVNLKPWPTGHGWAFLEFSRRHGDFAVASIAVLLTADASGRIERASITLGGMAYAPVRVTDAEQALLGSTCGAGTIETAAEACSRTDALDDPHAPAWYRKRLARTLAGRAITTAIKRIDGAGK